MINRKINCIKYSVATALTLGLTFTSGIPAMAQFTVVQNDNAEELWKLLFGTEDLDSIEGLNITSQSNTGCPAAFGEFWNDPFNLGTSNENRGVVISTGEVTDIPGENTKDSLLNGFDLSTAFNDEGCTLGGEFDQAELTITFNADRQIVERLEGSFVFGSEEFVENGGSLFNDSLQVLFNGDNIAKLSDGQQDVNINNLVPTGNPLGQPPENPHPDYINNPSINNPNFPIPGGASPRRQAKLDGFTEVLDFKVDLKDMNTLTFQIMDVEDDIRDSVAFFSALELIPANGTPPPDPKVPEPTSILSLIGFAAFGAVSRFKPK
jgi:hypothetical protein